MACGYRDLVTREAKSDCLSYSRPFLEAEAERLLLIRGRPNSKFKEKGPIEPSAQNIFTLDLFL